MNLFELMVKYPLRLYAGAIILGGLVIGVVEAIMTPAVLYVETLAEEKASQKKSD